MAEVQRARNSGRSGKVQELIRDSIEAAQARLETLEDEAQKLFQEVSTRVQKVSKKDWKELRGQVEKLRRAGLDAAEEWKDKAEEWRDKAQSFRGEAVDRLLELQVRAVKFLGVASREEVLELSREINKILKRLDEVQKRRSRKPARKPEAQA
ncbi:MAG TPA: hypothetical protein VMK42_05940 [Anaeromyxobacteraceae bacterium]|nr:hypothetical protein [Anaeromyxobacteraceae bacterium]